MKTSAFAAALVAAFTLSLGCWTATAVPAGGAAGNRQMTDTFDPRFTHRRAQISSACMRCICQAESGCHPPYRGCDNDEEPCGPFQVTKSTWFDALQDPTQGIGDVSFKECASTYQCSAKVVRGYVSHHATGPAVSGEFATCEQATTVFGRGQGRGSDGARVLWAQVQICLRAP